MMKKKIKIKNLFQLKGKYEIKTPDGFVPIGDLVIKDGVPCVKINFISGNSLECSEDHLVETNNGFHLDKRNWKRAIDLRMGDEVHGVELEIVKGIDFLGIQTTYDMEVLHKHHRYYTNGISSHNTGVGKTRLATHHAIKGINKKAPYMKIKVVVPKEFLKEDWEGVKGKKGYIQQYGLKNVEVWIINSFVKVRHKADFLIIDEIHRAGNEEAKHFSKVLEVCPAPYVMGLSATLSHEQKMFFQERNVSVISTITTRQAESEGLISPYKIYNLGLQLTNEDRKYADELHDNFIKFSGKFDEDMHLAIQCSSSTNPRWDPTLKEWYEPPAVEFARDRGWQGIDLDQARDNYMRKKNAPHGRKGSISIWEDENDDFEFTPGKVQYYGRQYIKYMNTRKDFLHNSVRKLEVTEEIIRKFNVPTIIFSERTNFADRIANILGSNLCGIYHSKLESKPLSDDNGELILYKSGDKKGKPKMFGKVALKRVAIRQFALHLIQALSTATAMDEGLDVPGIELGIITSGTGVQRQNTQRVGRAVRPEDGKIAVIVNLYIKNSQDEKWLNQRQLGDKKPLWIDSVNEINFEPNGIEIKINDSMFLDEM